MVRDDMAEETLMDTAEELLRYVHRKLEANVLKLTKGGSRRDCDRSTLSSDKKGYGKRYKYYYFIGSWHGMRPLPATSTVGYSVSGYDRTPSALPQGLRKREFPYTIEDDISVTKDKDNTFVIYTLAVPADTVSYGM